MNINNETSCVRTDQFDENSNTRRRSKGKRRSSILKMTKSPKSALDDIDPNAQNPDDGPNLTKKSKSSRRSSSRRVSFASTCQIKEFVPTQKDETHDNGWQWGENQYSNDENAQVPTHLELPNVSDESTYRQPAETLEGLSSLLSSPIQDSPQKTRFSDEAQIFERSGFPDNSAALEFTQCYPGVTRADEDDNTGNQMDLTANQTLEIIQNENACEEMRDTAKPKAIEMLRQLDEIQDEVVSNSFYYSQETVNAEWKNDEQNFDEKTASLDLTKCYGEGLRYGVDTNEEMEFTSKYNEISNDVRRSYENINQETQVRRQVLAQIPHEAVTNRGDFQNRYNVPEEYSNTQWKMLGGNQKADGSAFLKQLGGGEDWTGDEDETTNQFYLTNQNPDMDFTRSVPMTDRKKDDPGFSIALDGDMDMTRCLGNSSGKYENYGGDISLLRQEEDVMDMTRCLPGTGKYTPDPEYGISSDQDMDMTRCLIKAAGKPESVTLMGEQDEMDMTRCLQGTGRKEGGRGYQIAVNDGNMIWRNKYEDLGANVSSLGRQEEMDMTKCAPATKRRVDDPKFTITFDRDMGAPRCMAKASGGYASNKGNTTVIGQQDEMDLTKWLPGTEKRRDDPGFYIPSDMATTRGQATDARFESKVGDVSLMDQQDDMDMTRCLPGSRGNDLALNITTDHNMDMTKCLPKLSAGSYGNKGVHLTVLDQQDQMDMTRCLPGTEKRMGESNVTEKMIDGMGYNIALEKDMEMTRCLPKSSAGSYESNVTVMGQQEQMDMSRCLPGTERKYDGLASEQDTETTQLSTKVQARSTNQEDMMEMTRCFVGTARKNDELGVTVATDYDMETRRTVVASSGRESKGPRGTLFLNNEDEMEMTKCVPVPTRNNSESARLKQGNLERKANLDLSSMDSVESKRRALYRDRTLPVGEDITHDEPRLSQTLPAQGTAAKVVPKVGGDASVILSNSTWATSGTHEAKRAGKSIFAAGGPSFASKLSLLKRKSGVKIGNIDTTKKLENGNNDTPEMTINGVPLGVPDKYRKGGSVLSQEPAASDPGNDSGSDVLPVVAKEGVDELAKIGVLTNHDVVTTGKVAILRDAVRGGVTSGDVAQSDIAGADVSRGHARNTTCNVPCIGDVTGEVAALGIVDTISDVVSDINYDSVPNVPADVKRNEYEGNMFSGNHSDESLIADEKSDVLLSDEVLGLGMAIPEDLKRADNIPIVNNIKEVAIDQSFDVLRSEIMPKKKNLSVISEECGIDQSMKNDQTCCDKVFDGENPQCTLKEFFSMADVKTTYHTTKRSETPFIEADESSEMKDLMYKKCLFDAKFDVLDNFTKELQTYITENDRLFSVKEKQFNGCNPAVFGELKQAVETNTEDDLLGKLAVIRRQCRYEASVEWYKKRTKTDKEVVLQLKEQEEKLEKDKTILENRGKELDECLTKVEKLCEDYDKKFEDLETSLETKEKKLNERKNNIQTITAELESLEPELKAQEIERGQRVSENDNISREIAETKKNNRELESEIERLEKEASTVTNLADIKKQLRFCQSVLEWVLEEYDGGSLKFTFLCRTFDLSILFEDCEDCNSPQQKIKDINFESCLSENSSDLGKLGHNLVLEYLSQFNFVEMCPTRAKLPQLLHLISETVARLRALLEVMDIVTLNHLISVKDKVLKIGFSSLKNFIKFELNFDLSRLVVEGVIPYTVVRKIGTISSETIAKKLENVPPNVLCFMKLVKVAECFLK